MRLSERAPVAKRRMTHSTVHTTLRDALGLEPGQHTSGDRGLPGTGEWASPMIWRRLDVGQPHFPVQRHGDTCPRPPPHRSLGEPSPTSHRPAVEGGRREGVHQTPTRGVAGGVLFLTKRGPSTQAHEGAPFPQDVRLLQTVTSVLFTVCFPLLVLPNRLSLLGTH